MKLTAQTDAAKAILPLITNKHGELRASKPKDGNAAYVWRMVGFAVSPDPKMQCMPVTADFGVAPPEEWCVQPPAEWLSTETQRANHPGYFAPGQFPADMGLYLRDLWTRYDGMNRRRHYVKTVLDPIAKEIVDAVPVRRQAGTMRWARAFGVAA